MLQSDVPGSTRIWGDIVQSSTIDCTEVKDQYTDEGATVCSWYWGSNPGPCMCSASTPLLKLYPHQITD